MSLLNDSELNGRAELNGDYTNWNPMARTAGETLSLLEAVTKTAFKLSTNTFTLDDTGRVLTREVDAAASLVIIDGLLSYKLRIDYLLDALTIADASLMAKMRTIRTQDNITLLDALLVSVLRQRLGSDTVVTLDFSSLSKVKGLLASDLITVTDQLQKQMVWGRSVTDVVTLIDAIIAGGAAGQIYTSTLTDTLTVSDQVQFQLMRNRWIGEALLVTDEAFFAKGRFVVSTDSITIDDSGRTLVYDVNATGSLTLLETIINGNAPVIVTKITSDLIVVSDGYQRVVMRTRTLFDLITMQDPTTQSKETVSFVDETIDVADSTIARRLVQRISSEGLTLLDFLITAGANLRTATVSESVTVTEQAFRYLLRNRLQDEALSVTDGALYTFLRNRWSSDGLTTIDAIIKAITGAGFTYNSTITESVVFFDGQTHTTYRDRATTDAAVVLSEGTIRKLERLLTTIDAVSFNDGLLRVSMNTRSASEALGITDEALKALLFYITFDVRIFLGMQTEVVLGAHQDVFLNWSQPVNLGAYH